MSVGLEPPRDLLPVDGIRLASVAAGIRYQRRDDMVLIELAPGTRTAAVFTTNVFHAAPVTVARAHLEAASPRYLVINSGNANAGTGHGGIGDARETCRMVAEATECAQDEVLPFSTGVIGERLPMDRILGGVGRLVSSLDRDGWGCAAQAIMTTDTVAKGVSRRVSIGGRELTVTGIAKGAGMIRPDMATMLAFVATDAQFNDPGTLKRMLFAAADRSFNHITVDGDTSTNDACVLMATGASSIAIDGEGDATTEVFTNALNDVMSFLAQAIVRDGEGATRFITVALEQAHDPGEAKRVAYTVAHSPLVKTAFFAGDPNWGRILAAVGRSGLDDFDIGRVAIFLDEVQVVRDGELAPEYREEDGRRVMANQEITIRIRLGRGEEEARIWTTDLSHEYVRINAEYRT